MSFFLSLSRLLSVSQQLKSDDEQPIDALREHEPSAPPRDELGPIEEAIAEMRQLKQAIEPLLALAAPAPDEE